MFDNIKNALSFTKGEQVAIITLAAVLFLLIAANFFISKRPLIVNNSLHNLDSIWTLHNTAVSNQMSSEINNSPQLSLNQKKPKSISDIKHQSQNQNQSKSERQSQRQSKLININNADTLELLELPEIGPFFARNIVEYREKLGGYISLDQLLEVYAFDSARLSAISPYITIDSVKLKKIRINHDDFKSILRHPYIEYEDVKKIINYRESIGFIKNWNEYLKIVERDIDERVNVYLEY